MSRYIDVSDLNIPSDENDYDELVAFADKVAEMIADAPSIDIVRCKECKHWRNTDAEKIPTASIACGNMHADDFCSYGEREE